MKHPLLPRAIALATFTGLLSAAPAALADTKIAVIDMQRAISETNEGARAVDSLKKLFDKRQVELNQKQDTLLAEKQNLEKKCAKNPQQQQCQQGMEELQKKLLELQNLMMQYQGEIQKRQGEVMQPIQNKMQALVRRLAQQSGYDIVVDKAAIHHQRDGLDITEQAIKTYNSESNVQPLPPEPVKEKSDKGDKGDKKKPKK